MKAFSRLKIAIKAINQLGFQEVSLDAFYWFGLMTGHFRRMERRGKKSENGVVLRSLFSFPGREELLSVLGEFEIAALLAEADEIVSGKVRLFGADPVDLRLTVPGKMDHWSDYESGKSHLPQSLFTGFPAPDIKFVWEPARFGWAFILGRASILSGDMRYAEAFWQYFEIFSDANPPYF